MQTAKAQATANRIVTAASELFFADGYDATTVVAVADAAGVATGTVLSHYGSKSELATAAFANEIRDLVQAASATVPHASVTADLAHFVRRLYSWYDERGGVAPELLRQALFSRGPWADYYRQAVAQTVEVFAAIVVEHLDVPDGSSPLVGEGLLADYLLVLMQGLSGAFASVDDQVAHFTTLSETRIHGYR